MADHLKNKKQIEDHEQGQGQNMEDRLKRREENEVDEATAENKTPREQNEKEDGAAKKKRPRGENEEDEATAEKKKRPRKENEENVMSWTQPDIAVNGTSASSVDLHNEVQPQQKQEEVRGYSSSINIFHVLRDRQLGEYDIKKLPNILPNILGDYHLQTFNIGETDDDTNLVMADDTICVFHYTNTEMTCIVPFRRQVDPFQISVFTDDDNMPITNLLPGNFQNIYYNHHNNSLLMISTDTAVRQRMFISIKIRSIKAGLTRSYKQLFQGESVIYNWEVDIRNCRCMIYNRLEKVFKFYELREYNQLFTIPVPEPSSRSPDVPGFTFGSPESMEMLIHQRIFEESIIFRIYCKRNGKIRKEFFLPLDNNLTLIEYVLLCGSDRMVVQLTGRPLDVVDISCENPVYIKRTNIHATFEPYYLIKSSKFICHDSTIRKIRVCNLEGEILATLQDHPVNWFHASFSYGSHITRSEDIIISVCEIVEDRDLCSINVSSILTGECLAKISPHTANCSRIRQEALAYRIEGFAYDERTHEIFTTNNSGICCVWSNRFRNDVENIDNYSIYSEFADSTDDEPSGAEESEI